MAALSGLSTQDTIDELGRYYLGAAIALGLQLIYWSWALAINIS